MTVDERNTLVEAYLPYIRKVAHRFACCRVPYNDLVQEGVIGAITAIDRYDASYGVDLIRFIAYRILGAMRDAWRSADVVPRGRRVLLRRYDETWAAVAIASGRTPTHAEVTARLNLSREDIAGLELAQAVAQHASEPVLGSQVEPDPADIIADQDEKRALLRELFATISPRAATVLIRSVRDDVLLKTVADDLGISESGASFLRTDACRRMRKHLASKVA